MVGTEYFSLTQHVCACSLGIGHRLPIDLVSILIPSTIMVHGLLLPAVQAVSDGNHTSTDGRFVLEFTNGNHWILYSSDESITFYVPAQPNEPNK